LLLAPLLTFTSLVLLLLLLLLLLLSCRSSKLQNSTSDEGKQASVPFP
jgi:hypothetical protein